MVVKINGVVKFTTDRQLTVDEAREIIGEPLEVHNATEDVIEFKKKESIRETVDRIEEVEMTSRKGYLIANFTTKTVLTDDEVRELVKKNRSAVARFGKKVLILKYIDKPRDINKVYTDILINSGYGFLSNIKDGTRYFASGYDVPRYIIGIKRIANSEDNIVINSDGTNEQREVEDCFIDYK